MAGLSQGELGERLNVSSQAVSRWEHGGMPDAALLPKLAEILNCTPNDLYGFSAPSGDADLEAQIMQELRCTPKEQRTVRAIQLAWQSMKVCGSLSITNAEVAAFSAAASCEDADLNPMAKPGGAPTHCAFNLEDGLMQASAAIDFKYVLMMQEPEGGYASVLRDIQSYQKFFALFAREHRLEVYLLGYSLPKNQQFTRDYICESLNISESTAQEVLDDLCAHGLLNLYSIRVSGGCMESYTLPVSTIIVPLLFFAGKLMRDGKTLGVMAPVRDTPLMREPLPVVFPARSWNPIVISAAAPPNSMQNLGQEEE